MNNTGMIIASNVTVFAALHGAMGTQGWVLFTMGIIWSITTLVLARIMEKK